MRCNDKFFIFDIKLLYQKLVTIWISKLKIYRFDYILSKCNPSINTDQVISGMYSLNIYCNA